MNTSLVSKKGVLELDKEDAAWFWLSWGFYNYAYYC